MKTYMTVTMSDGRVWGVPIEIIARNRAEYYADEFDGDVERSLNEDTLLVFKDDIEISDWAQNNMNWSDFVGNQIDFGVTNVIVDYEKEWPNAEVGFSED